METPDVGLEEREYALRCQQGETDAFGTLYDRYIDRIYRFVYYKVHNKEVAEDIVSSVFIKALEKIRSFDPEKGPFSAWLYSIARNAVIDHYRSAKHHDNVDDIFDLGEDERTEEKIDARDTLEKVSAYLSTLSPKQREIIVLRIWEELPYRDIAEIVGGSEDSVKMAFSRAIREVREKFGPMGALALMLLKHLS